MANEEPAMSCDEVRPLLREATRGGLAEAARARVYAHLATCEACRGVADEERALDRLLETRLPQHPASLALKRRLQARLPRTAIPTPTAATVRRSVGRWLVPLGGVLAAACAVLVIGLGRQHAATDPLVTEAVADHLRVVYRDRPVDIESGGPHQVRPWFTGRLDFALPALFGGDGEFTLAGGSVGYYLDRKAAVLVYKRGLHTASLFVFRADGLAFPAPNQELGATRAAMRQERGFRVAVWREGQLGYALVSDVGADELVRLGARIADASR
jgi:anti-sigma factor RsiW